MFPFLLGPGSSFGLSYVPGQQENRDESTVSKRFFPFILQALWTSDWDAFAISCSCFCLHLPLPRGTSFVLREENLWSQV